MTTSRKKTVRKATSKTKINPLDDLDFTPSKHRNGHSQPSQNVNDDWIQDNDKDKRLAGLVDALMDTRIGKNRRAILTSGQMVALARARTYATLRDIPHLDTLCDILQDSTVSVRGKGLEQLVKILSARVSDSTIDPSIMRLSDRVIR